jgi:cbb3-type cytochrome oxidase cytochrome c subunit
VKGLVPLFLGLFGTFAFSWVGLTVIPNIQIGALNPQMDEEGTDIYPMPQSGMVERGRRVYAANGCIYCHSQQLRPDYASADIDRKWGERRSAPRDYLFDRPVLLGQERMGPDLSNIGKRAPAEEEKPSPSPATAAASPPAAPGTSGPVAAPSAPPPNVGPQKPPAGGPPPPANAAAQAKPPAPAASAPPTGASKPAGGVPPAAGSPAPPAGSPPAPSPAASASPNPNGMPPVYSAAWHYLHLYSPRSVNPDNRDSTMPAYKFLYEKHEISGERSADALQLTGSDAPPPGWEIVPTYDAKCLVAYLMSQDQSHPLKEVKSGAGAAPPAGSPAAAPAGSPANSPPPAPAKK